MNQFDIHPFPREREIVVDAGYLGTGRHIIYGLVEVDVTRPREMMRRQAEEGQKLSFTAFIAASLGRAIAANPQVQAYRDWRGRLVVFHDVDVVTMIEAKEGAVAIPHIIRGANHRSVEDLTAEIRTIQKRPASSDQQNKLVALAPRLPRFVRLFFFWAVKKNPQWFKNLQGTTVVTSVGMFGSSGGWGIGFLPSHTLGLTVGGIVQKPGMHDRQVAVREYLHLTLSFDHDIVDGAPAARFSRMLVELLETAEVLKATATNRPTPHELTEDLVEDVKDLVNGVLLTQANGLITKLENVTISLNEAKINEACNQLGAFSNQVSAIVSSGDLTAEQGHSLIDGAKAIQNDIGC